MNNDIVKKESPDALISLALDKGADLDKLEKLLTLKERYEKNEARKAYHVAMTAFKKNPPQITKDKKVAYKEVRYSHASLSNITKKITTALSEHGLSVSWIPRQNNGSITITCRITHEMGHYEEAEMTGPADNTGSKNPIQAIGSTTAYLERYTVLALTGLATDDMDDDGISGGSQFIDEKQKGQIVDYINGYQINEDKFLKFMKVESIDKITVGDFPKAIAALEAKRKAKK